MTKCRRRTRRHPDKWKQRARMRQIMRHWGDSWDDLRPTIQFLPYEFNDFVKGVQLFQQHVDSWLDNITIILKAAAESDEWQNFLKSARELGLVRHR